jgi:hypothetical protein
VIPPKRQEPSPQGFDDASLDHLLAYDLTPHLFTGLPLRLATVVFLRLTRLFVGHRHTFTAASHKLHESFERASLFASLKGSAPNERSVLSTALKRLVFEPPGRLSKAIPIAKNSTFFTVISETSCRESVGISEQRPQTGLAGLPGHTASRRSSIRERDLLWIAGTALER